MKIRKVILPYGAVDSTEEGTEQEVDPNDPEGILAALGINTNNMAQTEEQSPTEEPVPEGTQAEDPQTEFANAQANKAFAAMRTENSKYKNALLGLGEQLGVKDGNVETILDKLANNQLQAQAQQQNVPVEVLQRLKSLEDIEAKYNSDRLERNAYQGFIQLKQQYGLDDAQLQQFAQQLANSGMDPFKQKVDLDREYFYRNKDTIIANAVQRGIAQEQQRSVNAMNQGSTPNTTVGTVGVTAGTGEKINSISGLEALFRQGF